MGSSTAKGFQSMKEKPMRQRPPSKIPNGFKEVTCPYPTASMHYGAHGAVNYSLDGPSTGELVVCLHGLNASRTMFKAVGDALAKTGFQVLSFDMYGHGLSNAPIVSLWPCRMRRRCPCGRPRARYDVQFFVDQTVELMDGLGLAEQPANLIGFSFGGLIAVAFAKRFPDRVLRLILMSPAGCLPRQGSMFCQYRLLQATWCLLIPLAAHVLCPCCYRKDRWTKGVDGEEKEVVSQVWNRMVWSLFVKKGVASASLAIMLRVPWFGQEEFIREVGKHPRPVLLLWGAQDNFNPTSEKFGELFSNSHLLVVPKSEHIVIADQPQLAFNSIYDFLQMPHDVDMRLVKPGCVERCRLVLDRAANRVESISNMPAPGILGAARAPSEQPQPDRV